VEAVVGFELAECGGGGGGGEKALLFAGRGEVKPR